MRVSFFRKYLEPAERLDEVLFGLIMVLTFTLTAGLAVGDGPDAARELLIATVGCNVAWGAIDAAMYLMDALLARSRQVRTVAAVQRAPDEATALAEVERVLDDTVFVLAPDEERTRLSHAVYRAAHHLPVQRVRIRRDDLYGALASGLLVMLSTVPAIVPFVLIEQPWRALRVSNALLVGLLFLVGYQWGKHAYTGPWRAGLVFLVVGLTLVGTAIALGG